MRAIIVLSVFLAIYMFLGLFVLIQNGRLRKAARRIREAEEEVIASLNKRAYLLKDLSLLINETTGQEFQTLYKACRMRERFTANSSDHILEQQAITNERILALFKTHPELFRVSEIKDLVDALWEAGQVVNEAILKYNCVSTDLNQMMEQFPTNLGRFGGTAYKHTLISAEVI